MHFFKDLILIKKKVDPGELPKIMIAFIPIGILCLILSISNIKLVYELIFVEICNILCSLFWILSDRIGDSV